MKKFAVIQTGAVTNSVAMWIENDQMNGGQYEFILSNISPFLARNITDALNESHATENQVTAFHTAKQLFNLYKGGR